MSGFDAEQNTPNELSGKDVTQYPVLMQNIINSVQQGLLILDSDLVVRYANDAFYETFEQKASRIVDHAVGEIMVGGWATDEITASLRRVIEDDITLRQYAVDAQTPHGRRNLMLNAHRLPAMPGYSKLVLLAIHDVTQVREAEAKRASSERSLEIALRGARVMLFNQDTDLRYTWVHGPTEQRELHERIIGKTDAELWPRSDDHQQLMAIKREVLKTKHLIEREITIHDAGGHISYYYLVVEPLYDAKGQLIGITGSSLDITATKRAEMRAHSLQILTAALSSASTLHEISNVITEQGLDLFGANYGGIALLNDKRSRLAFLSTTGLPAQAAMREVDLNQKSAITEAVHKNKIVVIDSTQVDREQTVLEGSSSVQMSISLPLIVEREIIGVLSLSFREAFALSDEELEYYKAVANQCAIAIDRARLAAKARDIAISQERQRLSRDLHDAVSQSLFSAQLIAEALVENSNENQQHLRQILALLNGAQSEMRLLLLELRPEQLIQGNVAEQLEYLVRSLGAQTKTQTEFSADDGSHLPAAVKVTIFRIAQAALNNIVRHANAQQLTLRLRIDERKVRLDIADDGIGFDLEQVNAGMGLQTIRERAAEIDAELTIRSAKNAGTHITMLWQISE